MAGLQFAEQNATMQRCMLVLVIARNRRKSARAGTPDLLNKLGERFDGMAHQRMLFDKMRSELSSLRSHEFSADFMRLHDLV